MLYHKYTTEHCFCIITNRSQFYDFSTDASLLQDRRDAQSNRYMGGHRLQLGLPYKKWESKHYVTNERALLERAKQYDEAALGELYDRYAPRIYAYIYRRVGDAHLAEDLTGDVFVRVIQAIQSERFRHTSFQAVIGHSV